MATIGVLIETDGGGVKATNYGVLTAARAGGANDVVAFVVGADPEATKADLGAYGAGRVIQVAAQSGDAASAPDLLARILDKAIDEFGLNGLMGLASAAGRDLFARLAALRELPLVSDAVGVDWDAGAVRKSHFSGKTFATIKIAAEPLLCTLRPNTIEAVADETAAESGHFEVPLEDPGLVEILEVQQAGGAKVDLTEAAVIVTGGRPIASADNFKMLEALAEPLGAAVGASRAAVDAGYAPHGMQVGQTGKTVSPKLYIACGLSGSVQHFAGMKTSKIIVAINTDKDAPIFEKCDYGIVGDIFDVVPMLTEALR
ncbi:MAG: electron transfer flavoprotein subunit alpha/FixB family protein [Desulfosarcinaceae bacterium]|nr:electron transfer flavoprotein subunit alpha/FixB family protein [Desulfosarcinaceae bacterium]